ncbi:MAG: polyprenyl synthetase family protein [Candidatus Omnitrophica bacterium]|nr:polyprenyl synthetase family protein [Candidatus Omnitrophota bacterium]
MNSAPLKRRRRVRKRGLKIFSRYAEIEKALKRHLPKGDDALSRAMRYSVFSGGKRIRPILTIESALVCRGSLKDALPAAAAIELVHTYSLIHDDLPAMDNDDLRRGKSTCHKVFGEANAILAGDALLTLAFNIIAKNTKPALGIKIIEELSRAIGVEGMVAGQALDLEFRGKAKKKMIAEKINILKTAELFSAAAKIGALAAGAPTGEIKALGRFGLDLGLSFQVVDDFIDGESADNIEARRLAETANKELAIFGGRARKLKDISDYLLKRKK